MKPEDFADREPHFILEDYFEGHTKAWGFFQDLFGEIRREFVVDITGERNGNTVVLTEDFVYADGEIERRVWTLRRLGDRRYEGVADGVVGKARGRACGNAFNWSYVFQLKIGGRRVKVRFNDWMLLQPGGVMINRATVRKFGILLGQAFIFFQRLDDAPDAPAIARAVND